MTGPFLPLPGRRPPRCEPRRDERVLHVALKAPGDPQTALCNALRALGSRGGSYTELDWMSLRTRLPDELIAAAKRERPSLIWCQVQTNGVLTGGEMELARRFCDPSCVVVNWNGDRRHDPSHSEFGWMRNLGPACDLNLVTCTADAVEWARLGIPGAGYLQIGVDADLWQPTAPDPSGPDVLLLASYYQHLGYHTRLEAAKRLTAAFPGRFAVYGHGWGSVSDVASRPFVPHAAEAPLYSKSLAALSVSIRNDLPRYTSDRLLRCLAAGALTLVEHFPDMEGLGLRDGENCAIWYDVDGLERLVADVLSRPKDEAWEHIRVEARRLALTHTWDARMGELAYMVEAVREARK